MHTLGLFIQAGAAVALGGDGVVKALARVDGKRASLVRGGAGGAVRSAEMVMSLAVVGTGGSNRGL